LLDDDGCQGLRKRVKSSGRVVTILSKKDGTHLANAELHFLETDITEGQEAIQDLHMENRNSEKHWQLRYAPVSRSKSAHPEQQL
jgi:hypothetical protein